VRLLASRLHLYVTSLLEEFDEFEFGFGGSIVLTNRFLLSLVVALFLSTLALANSIDATELLHSGLSANDHASTSAGYFSTSGGNSASAWLDAYDSHASPGDAWNARVGIALGPVMDGKGITDYKAGRIVFPGRKYGPTCCEARQGIGTGQRHALSTPEPGSLIMLSTGLMGIAGMVRRKLRIG